ncbi:pentatricopeptide repeat-containing protein At5g66520-like [Punica granatum]|uniref:Pentatricopeptide repeat-containing protein At5g66520-like n=2 Tax=Punica granatum TaxID=22663 RepID=A0A6P8D3W5_PUNGR|nr:pentatricopeptide repeat-containing protein At5g66520-like [Punica granatum]PKI43147.1 hypothetical protein CRG98_036453 [Punica granatum]
MISRQIEALLERPTTTSDLLQLHALLLKTGLCRHSFSVSRLIHRATSISLPLARSLFDGLPADPSPPPPPFAWNCLIRAHANSSTPAESVRIFARMLRAGLKADSFSYPFVLKACGQGSLIGEGRGVHSLILRTGFESDKFVGNTLLGMYAACGAVDLARQVFDEMAVRDVVSWTSLIASYMACDSPVDAFKVFRLMKLAGEKPNSATLVNLLSACSQSVNIKAGKSVHAHVIVSCMELDAALGTALLEMYSKCGDIERALQVFSSLGDKNLQSWTAMISGLAESGFGKEAILFFAEMEQSGLKPDGVSFLVILSACSHSGLVEEGRQYFDQMERVYGIKPSVEHYGCMVDLLGRAGLIEEAYEMIKKMPMEPNSIILRSFIGASTIHGLAVPSDDTLRKLMLELEPELGANYVLAANWSSSSCNWDDAAKLKSTMKERGVRKTVGSSWVEVNGDDYAEGAVG